MQDLFMYFYQDNCDLNDVNYWWNIIKRDHVSATHLRSDSHVAVDTIMYLCEILNCQPSDIMEYIPPESV